MTELEDNRLELKLLIGNDERKECRWFNSIHETREGILVHEGCVYYPESNSKFIVGFFFFFFFRPYPSFHGFLYVQHNDPITMSSISEY